MKCIKVEISEQMRDMLLEFAKYQTAGRGQGTESQAIIEYQIDRFLDFYSWKVNERLRLTHGGEG